MSYPRMDDYPLVLKAENISEILVCSKKVAYGKEDPCMNKPIPEYVLMSRYWKPLIFLFSEHPKLAHLFTTKYVDLEREQVRVRALRYASREWNKSEKFMLNLALHLFNASNKLPNGLDDMDVLDTHNTHLALKAIRMRYDYWGE